MKAVLVSDFYKNIFNSKVYKISIDAGCTCPNRDGTKATGGCIFCSQNGSGDFIPSKQLSVSEQIEKAKELVNKKFPKSANKKYIAYFQNFTNTYGNEDELFQKYNDAINCKNIVGISIGTRPDCIKDSMLEKISQLCNKTFVQLEIGLQTTNEETGKLINRFYTDSDYFDAVKRIFNKDARIHIVTHLISGLPGESKETFLKSLDQVISNYQKLSDKIFFGIKITQLYVLQNTVLEIFFNDKRYVPLSLEDYLDILKDALKIIPENIVIHRLTGDPPKKYLVEPKWSANKKDVLNKINKLINFS